MKRMLSLTLTLLLMGLLLLPALASTEPQPSTPEVLVTVVDRGTLVATRVRVAVTDADSDDSLTIHDALYALHEARYEGGAAAGYGAAASQWGFSLTKLWGNESGNFGYYLNNTAATSLLDPIEDGASICAFVYSDSSFSDVYAYFTPDFACKQVGEQITLTLMQAGYDEGWNPISLPVADATITVNGTATDYKTDAEGRVTLTLDTMGELVISATSADVKLVPPVAVLEVEAAPLTFARVIVPVLAVCAVLLAVAVGVVLVLKKGKV